MANSSSEQHLYDTPEQVAENIAKWRQAMEISHAMLMAGLRDRAGTVGDLEQAYRDWNRCRREEKLLAYHRAAQRYRDWQTGQQPSKEQFDAT